MLPPLFLPIAAHNADEVNERASNSVHRLFDAWLNEKLQQLHVGFSSSKPDVVIDSDRNQLTHNLVDVLTHRTFNYQSKKNGQHLLPSVQQTMASSIALGQPIPFLYLYNGGYRASPFPNDSALIFTPDVTELMLLYQIAMLQQSIQPLYSPGIEFTIVINNGVAQDVNDVPLVATEQYVQQLRTMINWVGAEKTVRVLVQFGSDGTLGVIGKVVSALPYIAYNANNTFLAGTGLNRVYRLNTTMCNLGGIIEGITTTFPQLNPSQSSALTNNLGCAYPVINPPSGFTSGHFCNSSNMLVSGSFGDDDFDPELAAQIAQGQIEYEVEFDEGASRIHEEMLLAWLIENDTVRNTHPLLDSFYLAHYSTTAGQLVNVDLLLSKLSDSLLMITPAAWQATLSDAKMNNNAINPQALFDAHAKAINALYIKSIEYGIDTLSVEERETIEQLANACPLIAGNGVYRARTLHSMLEPGIHYDDIVICNSQGVYKNGSSKLQQQLDKLQKDRNKGIGDDYYLQLYPNPSSDLVNLKFKLNENESGEFIVYDILGNKVIGKFISSNTSTSMIDISSLSSGVYSYKLVGSNQNVFTGKLIKK